MQSCLLKFARANLQINVNTGRYLYMHISHTEWFAKWFFADLMQTFICGNKSVTTNFLLNHYLSGESSLWYESREVCTET
jgi:hypothetical protein